MPIVPTLMSYCLFFLFSYLLLRGLFFLEQAKTHAGFGKHLARRDNSASFVIKASVFQFSSKEFSVEKNTKLKSPNHPLRTEMILFTDKDWHLKTGCLFSEITLVGLWFFMSKVKLPCLVQRLVAWWRYHSPSSWGDLDIGEAIWGGVCVRESSSQGWGRVGLGWVGLEGGSLDGLVISGYRNAVSHCPMPLADLQWSRPQHNMAVSASKSDDQRRIQGKKFPITFGGTVLLLLIPYYCMRCLQKLTSQGER